MTRDPTPNFGQMAHSTTGFIRDRDPERLQALELNIIDLLRQVWNSRGEADRNLVEQGLLTMLDVSVNGPPIQVLKRELRKLDR